MDERLTVDNQCLAGSLSLSASDTLTGASAQIDWTDWTVDRQDNADHRTGKVLNRSFINSRRHTVVGVGDGDDDEGCHCCCIIQRVFPQLSKQTDGTTEP